MRDKAGEQAAATQESCLDHGRKIARSAAEWRPPARRRARPRIANFIPGCAAVGARIVRAFERSVRMQHHRAGMAHRSGIRLRHHIDIMAGGHQPVDQVAVEAAFQHDAAVRRAPGAADEPARAVERLVERLAEQRRGG